MTLPFPVLQCGSCERIKAGVHATALGLAALMGIYNAAAWVSRRQAHLAVNAVLYTVLTAWEQQHVAHHISEMRRATTRRSMSEETTAAVNLDDAAA